MCQIIDDSFKKLGETCEETNRKLDDFNRSMENCFKETKEEMENKNEPAEKQQDINTLSSANEFDRNQGDIQYKEIDAGGIEKTQVIKEAEDLVAEREDLEQNNLPMCDDQVETKELPLSLIHI